MLERMTRRYLSGELSEWIDVQIALSRELNIPLVSRHGWRVDFDGNRKKQHVDHVV